MSNAIEEPTAPTHRRAADRLLLSGAWQSGPWLVPLILTALVLAAASIALPAVLGRAADAIIGRASKSWLTWAAVVVGALVVCDALEDLAAGATTARSTAWLRHSVLRHLLALGTRSSEQFTPGDAASRLAGNAADAGRVAPDVVRAVANAVPAVGGIVALGLIDPWLCVTFLAGLPILAFLVRLFAREATDIAQRYLEVQARIAGRLVEVLSGARTIAAAGTGDREAERVLGDLPDLHRHGIDMWRAQIRISTQDAMIVALLEVAVLAVAGAELAHGRITPGELLAASQYVVLSAALGNAVTSIGRLARDRAAAWRTAEVLGEAPVRYGTTELPPGPGRIEFRGVMGYEGHCMLEPASTSWYLRGRSWPSSAGAAPGSRCWEPWRAGSSTPTRETCCWTGFPCRSSATRRCGAPSPTPSSGPPCSVTR